MSVGWGAASRLAHPAHPGHPLRVQQRGLPDHPIDRDRLVHDATELFLAVGRTAGRLDRP